MTNTKLTKKKATEILAHLPAAFQEIQDNKDYSFIQNEGCLAIHGSQIDKVVEHYGLDEKQKKGLHRTEKEENYSNSCACFGAFMHMELWLASFKAKCTEPRGLRDLKEFPSDEDAYWSFIPGTYAFHELLMKFPKYRKWIKDNSFDGFDVDGVDDHCDSHSPLSNFLHKECGAPQEPFGGNQWLSITPVEVLTNLNDWLDIETAK